MLIILAAVLTAASSSSSFFCGLKERLADIAAAKRTQFCDKRTEKDSLWELGSLADGT